MARPDTKKAQAWRLFDPIVTTAPKRRVNPWTAPGAFAPDYDTLQQLLGVPLLLNADTTSGVPALALDVWVAYELRRAGLNPDWVWPREEPPRVIPRDILTFVDHQTGETKRDLQDRIRKGGNTHGGTLMSSANILGKNYLKQVDVILSHWSTGPEVMISTKRMDSSFGNNAANRVEESYGDAKNLRLRHPQAACGFVYGLRSTCWDQSDDKAEWLVDLLTKLGREDDAYHAVALVVPEYDGQLASPATAGADPDDAAPIDATPVAEPEPALPETDDDEITQQLNSLPHVTLQHHRVPHEISPERFFAVILGRLLDNTPINFHKTARQLREHPKADLLAETSPPSFSPARHCTDGAIKTNGR